MNVKVTPLDAWEFHDVTYAQSLEVVGEAIEVPGFDEEFNLCRLTKKDIELIHTFLYAVKHNKQGAFTFTRLSDEQYEEVLRRFNNRPQE